MASKAQAVLDAAVELYELLKGNCSAEELQYAEAKLSSATQSYLAEKGKKEICITCGYEICPECGAHEPYHLPKCSTNAEKESKPILCNECKTVCIMHAGWCSKKNKPPRCYCSDETGYKCGICINAEKHKSEVCHCAAVKISQEMLGIAPEMFDFDAKEISAVNQYREKLLRKLQNVRYRQGGTKMMTREELNANRPCQYIGGKLIPCEIVISHQECYDLLEAEKAKVERLEKVAKIARHLIVNKHSDPDGKYLLQYENWLEELKQSLTELEVAK